MAEIKYVDWDGLVYYDGKSKQYINDKFDSALKFGGSCTIDDVPSPGLDTINFTYKITDKFVVSPESLLFVDRCLNHEFEAGTVLVVVDAGQDIYKFDVLFEAIQDYDIELSGYYTKDEVDVLISKLPTKAYVDNAVKNITVDTSNFATKDDITNVEASIPSVEGLASETYVEETVARKIAEAELADKEADLSAFYTKSEVDALIPDDYLTEEDLQNKDFATKDDLAAYAKDEDLNTVSLNVEELGKNVTKNTADIENIDDAVANNTGAVEALRGEVTEVSEKVTDLQEAVNNISIPEVPTKVSELENDAGYLTAEAIPETDLSNYYNKTETETLVNEAVNGITIPDTSNFITMQDVEDKGYLTEHQDISGKADIDHKHTLADIDDYSAVNLEPYALKTDIPSIEGLATETFVTNAIAEAELNDKEVDLTGYATKDELSAVEAKIPSIEGLATETFVTESINNIQPTDLSNYYNKTETENLVDDAVKEIIVPEVPTNVSAFTNDANYTTLTEVATQGYLTSIPDEYVTSEELAQEGFLKEHQSLEGYVKDAELTDAIEAVEHKIVTKTSELENDAEFVTASTLPAFVKPDDITDFVTLTEVEEAGFIKSIPGEYVTETELADLQFVTEESLSQKGFITDVSNKADKDHTHSYNDLTDLPAIPSIEGLATKDYVDEAVANIDAPAVDTTNLLTKDEANTLLATKANDVPFADDYRVGTTLGGFVVDESLQGMTVVQILTKLLNLNLHVPPVADVPEGTPEQAVEVITKETPVYVIGESGEQVEITYDYTTMTPEEAVKDNQSDSYFYQIIDPETGEAVESGYQIATIYQENDYLTVYIPETVTKFHVEEYSALAGDWSQPTWSLIENPEYNLEGYVAYTADPAYEVYSGITVRVVIDE